MDQQPTGNWTCAYVHDLPERLYRKEKVRHICTGTGARRCPHLRRDSGRGRAELGVARVAHDQRAQIRQDLAQHRQGTHACTHARTHALTHALNSHKRATHTHAHAHTPPLSVSHAHAHTLWLIRTRTQADTTPTTPRRKVKELLFPLLKDVEVPADVVLDPQTGKATGKWTLPDVMMPRNQIDFILSQGEACEIARPCSHC